MLCSAFNNSTPFGVNRTRLTKHMVEDGFDPDVPEGTPSLKD